MVYKNYYGGILWIIIWGNFRWLLSCDVRKNKRIGKDMS